VSADSPDSPATGEATVAPTGLAGAAGPGAAGSVRPPAPVAMLGDWLSWIVLLVFAAAIAILAPLGLDERWESAALLSVLNILFVAAASLAVTYLAGRTYVVDGDRAVLALGAGALALGIVYMLTGALLVRLDDALTVHNSGCALAGALFLTSALIALSARSRSSRASVWPLTAVYGGVAAALLALVLLTLGDHLPAFYVTGEGSTTLRHAVLGIAALEFGAAAGVMSVVAGRSGRRFAHWYWPALALFALGLVSVWLGEPASALGWLGRAAQYVGGVFMLVAALAGAQESGVWTIALRSALVESEQRYRRLFDSMEEGFALHELLYDERGTPSDYRFLEVNPAFGRLTGIDPVAATGRTALEVIPGLEPGWIARYARVVSSGRAERFEQKVEALGRWYEGYAYPAGDDRFVVLFSDISERKLADDALRRSERRAELLARTAGALLAGADPQPLVERLCRDVMTELDCQLFFNYLVDETQGRLRLNAAGGVSPEEAAGIEWLDFGEAVCGAVAQDGSPIVAEQVQTSEDERTTLVRSFGVRAYACHPITVQDRLLGTLSFGTSTRSRFAPDELELMKAVTDQVAIAMERKRAEDDLRSLYDDQRRIATTLQEQFIHPLPEVAGLSFAALSQPASRPELVGGDFHDVFQLPHGLVVVLIGDVEGKGVRAAGLSETVRSGVRALAIVSPSPRYILNNVNRLLLQQESEQFVTALLMVVDPSSGAVWAASAGHPPPIVLRHGDPVRVAMRFGPPLGTFEWSYEQSDVTLSAGDTLIAYTDGISEARRGRQMFGEGRILTTLGETGTASLDETITLLHDAVRRHAGDLRDDAQLIAMRFTGLRVAGRDSTSHRLQLALPDAPWQLIDIRGAVHDFVHSHGFDDATTRDLVLCVEEACTNALRHSGSIEPTVVHIEMQGSTVQIEVKDSGSGFDLDSIDLSHQPDTLALGGRGLFLIKSFADEFEIANEDGAVVRIRKRRPEPPDAVES